MASQQSISITGVNNVFFTSKKDWVKSVKLMKLRVIFGKKI
jgi:hypothetical protein